MLIFIIIYVLNIHVHTHITYTCYIYIFFIFMFTYDLNLVKHISRKRLLHELILSISTIYEVTAIATGTISCDNRCSSATQLPRRLFQFLSFFFRTKIYVLDIRGGKDSLRPCSFSSSAAPRSNYRRTHAPINVMRAPFSCSSHNHGMTLD